MQDLLNIGQLAKKLEAEALGSCCARTAWFYVDKNPGLIKRVKRGKFTFFKPAQAARLVRAIIQGKARR